MEITADVCVVGTPFFQSYEVLTREPGLSHVRFTSEGSAEVDTVRLEFHSPDLKVLPPNAT